MQYTSVYDYMYYIAFQSHLDSFYSTLFGKELQF